MEKYVVSRELAEKLKAAGYPQETQFWYYWNTALDDDFGVRQYSQGHLKMLKRNDKGIYYQSGVIRGLAAPLSDELLEQLPMDIAKPGVDARYSLSIMPDLEPNRPDLAIWWLEYNNGRTCDADDGVIHSHIGTGNLADALAELWLWCKENGYVS